MACPPPRTVLARFRAHGSPSFSVPEAYFVISQHSHDLRFGMEPKDCLPSPQLLAFVRVTTAYTLVDPSHAWLLDPLQANVGYYGDSVAIQVK